MKASRICLPIVLASFAAAGDSFAGAENRCLAAGEPIQWIADFCMLKTETDDEIAASGCIEKESRRKFRSACASNTHFKQRMCDRMIRNGTRSGSLSRCLKDPAFKGRTVEAGGVGARSP